MNQPRSLPIVFIGRFDAKKALLYNGDTGIVKSKGMSKFRKVNDNSWYCWEKIMECE